jgi:hypothetical protein
VQDAATAEIKALEAQAATDKQENTRLTGALTTAGQENTRLTARISERDAQLATAAADLKSQAAACAAAANEAAAKASADAKRFAAGISERDAQLVTAAANLKSQAAAAATALATATQTNDYLTALIACQDEPLQECSCDRSGENDCDAALGQCCIALGVCKQLDDVCPACTDEFKWFKFEVTSIRGGADDEHSSICGLAGCVQFSELNLYDTTGALLPLDGATNPGGSSPGAEGPEKTIDDLVGTKFLDSTFTGKTTPASSPVNGSSVLIFQNVFETKVRSYELYSANDTDNRDPGAWTLSGGQSDTGPWRSCTR